MNYYYATLKKATDFKSRSARKEYWLFYLTNLAIIYLASFSENGTGIFPKWIAVPLSIFILFSIIPWLAVTVRRLHDTGHSAWWVLVPVANLVLLFFDSTPGTNKYGLNPKGIEVAPVLTTKAKIKKALIVIGAVATPIAIIFIVAFSATQPLVKTANAYFDALKKGEIEKSYQEYTSIEFRKDISLADYTAQLEKDSPLKHEEKVSFNSRKVSGELGYLSGTITTDYGSVVAIDISFVKEGGVWKIAGFHIRERM